MVGRVLSELGPTLSNEIPWQRVVNAKGAISPRGDVDACRLQYEKLVEEGVALTITGGAGLTTTFDGSLTAVVNFTESGWFPQTEDDNEEN